ncbi:protein of unknown function (plasmid) [Caballeronia sp. S22]
MSCGPMLKFAFFRQLSPLGLCEIAHLTEGEIITSLPLAELRFADDVRMHMQGRSKQRNPWGPQWSSQTLIVLNLDGLAHRLGAGRRRCFPFGATHEDSWPPNTTPRARPRHRVPANYHSSGGSEASGLNGEHHARTFWYRRRR